MTEINKLALKNFYENNKERYFERRNSGNKEQWNEQYKWDILPSLNQELASFKQITKANLQEFLSIVIKNSNKSNFAHWIDMDDLKLLANLNYGNQILDEIWQSTPNSVANSIDAANSMSNSFPPYKKFSPSTWGYILTAKDSHNFSIYRDFIYKELVEINQLSGVKGLTQGEKYQLFNNSALYLGQLVQEDKGSGDSYKYKALNGQDFLWTIIGYKKGTGK